MTHECTSRPANRKSSTSSLTHRSHNRKPSKWVGLELHYGEGWRSIDTDISQIRVAVILCERSVLWGNEGSFFEWRVL